MKNLSTNFWSWAILTLGIAASLTSCRDVEDEYHHYKLRFENNSDKDIDAAYRFESKHSNDYTRGAKDLWYYRERRRIEKREAKNLWADIDFGSSPNWEYCIQRDTVVFHILDADFRAIGDSVEHRLAEYRFACQDLYELNWHIAFPPTEEMMKYNVKVEDKYLVIQENSRWE